VAIGGGPRVVLLTGMDTPGRPRDLDVVGKTVYGAAGDGGLLVLGWRIGWACLASTAIGQVGARLGDGYLSARASPPYDFERRIDGRPNETR
jgi:hypothetical protein